MNKTDYFMELAKTVALASKDADTKVGAVIVDRNNRVISTGYNGPPKGVRDTADRLSRPHKYKYVLHAELNAILFAKTSLDGCTLYVTLQPCLECTKALIQVGISKIVYQNDRPCTISLDLLTEAGIIISRAK